MSAQPGDGAAIILHLIEAARAARDAWHLDPSAPGYLPLIGWVGQLEAWLEREAPASGGAGLVGWEARTWGGLLEGDTVSVGGETAVVESAITMTWHVDPDPRHRRWHEGPDAVESVEGEEIPAACRSCDGHRCRKARGWFSPPLEHGRVALKLQRRDPVYQMPPGGEVETLRGQKGRAVDEASGRTAGLVLADREMVLASWAADAFETLQATGLSPEPVAMTPEVRS